jgi:hypothetical protein
MRSWDITADGQRFLMFRNAETADQLVTTINIALNWVEELKRRVPR